MSTITIGFIPRDRFCRAAECLQRIFDCTKIPFNLIVLDTKVPQNYRKSIEGILKNRKNIEIIYVDEYLDSFQARNMLIEKTEDDFICFIENDVYVEDGWLSYLLKACEEHPADVAVPLIFEPHGKSNIVHFDVRLGSISTVNDQEGSKLEILPMDRDKEMDRHNGNRRSAELIESHCILFRRRVLDRISFTAERISSSDCHIYLSLELYEEGVPIVFEPKSHVTFLAPPPIYPDEKEFYCKYWDPDLSIQTRARIINKWNLVDCPETLAFVKSRLRLAAVNDPNDQLNYLSVFLYQVEIAIDEISGIVPRGETFILADEAQFNIEDMVKDRHAMPFIEKNGQYWGRPLDDKTAIMEFERLKEQGAKFIVFGWPVFWWFDCYPEFYKYIRTKFRCVFENERLLVFNLR